MGEVWRARGPRVDRLVAIKVSKAEFSERFSREARGIAQLNHPHICQLYDVGPNYLVLEYVEGSPLKGICGPQVIRHARELFSLRSLRLVPRRWTHGDELDRGALGSRSVVVHLIWDIVDDAARPHGNGVVLIELRSRAD